MKALLGKGAARFRAVWVIGIVAVVAAAVVAGCGSDSSSDTSTSSGGSSDAPQSFKPIKSAGGTMLTPPSECGKDAKYTVEDPDNVLKTLDPKTRAAYDIWPFPVAGTPWKDAPAKKPPYKLGYIEFPVVNAWQKHVLEQIKKNVEKAKEAGLVSDLVTYIQPSMATATPDQQIGAIHQMMREGVDGILIHPLNPDATAAAMDEAGKAGIPVVTILTPTSKSKYVINVMAQNFPFGSTLALLKPLGLYGKDTNVLMVRGLAGQAAEESWAEIGKADLLPCKGTKLVGEVWGDWNLAKVKTQVLQFLASHPEKIDVVLQNGSMAAGVIQAFEQAGRPVPLIAMANSNAGDLAWWDEHKDEYKSAGTTVNGYQASNASFRVLMRTLQGKGPKLRDMQIPAPTVTNENLAASLRSS